MSEVDAFETELADRSSDEPAMLVDVEGFEGPLDLLLALARQQKVDLAKISILALAEQYLVFIEAARKLRLELAADYLVMAAWLAYLKSRLLLPEPATPDGPSAEDMANALAWRLKRLEAFREVSGQLMGRPQLQRDVFRRGDPEPIADIKHPQWTATLYDLLSAYAKQRSQVGLQPRPVQEALGLGAAGGPRNPGAADRGGRRLGAARQVPDGIPGRALDAGDRDGLKPGGHPGAGPRGRAGGPPAERIRPDLPAQAGRGGVGGDQFECGDAARNGID